MELEAEVAQLKEKNEELEKKQVIFNVDPEIHTQKKKKKKKKKLLC